MLAEAVPDLEVTAVTASVIAEGALFAACRVSYTLEGKRSYAVALTVRRNEPFVTIDEYLDGFSPDDGAFLRFDLVPGFGPDRRDVMTNGGYGQ